MMQHEQETPEVKEKGLLISLAEAMMALKKREPREVAADTGIPLQNIQNFMTGNKLALSPEHSVKLFYYLGYGTDQSGSGLHTECVHIFQVDAQNMEHAEILRDPRIMPDTQVTSVPVQKSGVLPYLLKSGNRRILCLVSTGRFKKTTPWFMENVSAAYSAEAVPADLQESIFNANLGLNDFDELFSGEFHDWNDLRRIGNSHGITFREIESFLKQRSREMREPATAAVESPLPIALPAVSEQESAVANVA